MEVFNTTPTSHGSQFNLNNFSWRWSGHLYTLRPSPSSTAHPRAFPDKCSSHAPSKKPFSQQVDTIIENHNWSKFRELWGTPIPKSQRTWWESGWEDESRRTGHVQQGSVSISTGKIWLYVTIIKKKWKGSNWGGTQEFGGREGWTCCKHSTHTWNSQKLAKNKFAF